MNAEELIEAVRNLISERDAALARVAELEKDAGRYRWLRDEPTTHLYVRLKEKITTSGMSVCSGAALDHEVDKRIACDAPNVRDAGPTPYSGRTTRRDEG